MYCAEAFVKVLWFLSYEKTTHCKIYLKELLVLNRNKKNKK